MSDRTLFIRGLDKLGLAVSGEAVDRILLYCRELQKWNRRINLIARNTSATESIEKHFLDSLTLLPVIDQQHSVSATLLDVGTGAGFPGLVLAVVRPDFTVTLVEPRQKRVTFLLHIIRTLKLTNVRVIGERLEQANLDGREFTFITGRAVVDADRFLAMIISMARPDTQVIIMAASDDPKQWNNGTRAKNWQLVEQKKFQLPFSNAPRVVSVIRRYPSNM